MLTLRLFTSSILVFLLGCTVYSACRPMGTGVTWSEWETVNVNLMARTYDKNCIYTQVYENGEYLYDCTYE